MAQQAIEQLLELLQDHCSMSTDVAQETLETLTRAVKTGVVPAPTPASLLHLRGRLRSQSVGAEHESYGHLDAIRLLGGMLADSGIGYDNTHPKVIQEEAEDEITAATATATATATLSNTTATATATATAPNKATQLTRTPLKPDRLIPVDLLGEIDHPTMNDESDFTPIRQNTNKTPAATVATTGLNTHQIIQPHTLFPSSNKNRNGATPQSQHSTNGQQHGKKDLDLAAALFRPSRPRANSVNAALIPQKLKHHASTVDERNNEAQLQSTIQLLLTMNYDLSEEAAREAAKVAPNADVNIAQHVLDQAMAAPPVCRHMLHDACYRSDCQFSHDVEGHTCLFWLRGKCVKNNCKFLHGFSKKTLDGVNYFPTPSVSIKIQTTNLLEHNMQNSNYPPRHNNNHNTNSLSSSPTCSSPLFLSTSLDSFTPYYCSPISAADSKFLLPPRDKETTTTTSAPIAPSSPTNHIPLSSSLPEKSSTFSFAKIATKGYNQSSSFSKSDNVVSSTKKGPNEQQPHQHHKSYKKVKWIKMPPELLWNSSSTKRKDTVELTHLHTAQTFPSLLATVLPEKLRHVDKVWILFQRSNKVDLNTVIQWLLHQQQPHYEVFKTKDTKALCVKKQLQQQPQTQQQGTPPR